MSLQAEELLAMPYKLLLNGALISCHFLDIDVGRDIDVGAGQKTQLARICTVQLTN
jgi:hypothetical protein